MIVGPGGEQTFFEAGDVAHVGDVREGRQGGSQVAVELTDDAVADATEAFRQVGATDAPEESSFVLRIDGEEQTFAVGKALVHDVDTGEWDGAFLLTFEERERVERVRDALAT